MLFLQNTKLYTQILCLVLVLMLFCFGILIGIININFYYFEHIIVESSMTILEKQFKAEIKTQSYFSKLLIERYQQREKSRLESVNKIFQFTWENEIDVIDAENCLNQNITKYSGECSMCYGIINKNADFNSTKFKEYLQIVNLFSFTWLMRDNKFEILFAGTTEEKFIAVWPRFGIISFDPQSRPWYTIQANQPFNSTLYQTQFTEPYQHVVYKCTTVSHTQSLYDQNFQMIGVVAVQLNFSTTFPNYLQNSNSIIGYILNEQYTILQMKGEYQTINSFFDQNITGFNQSIKTILTNYVNQNQILQYCINQNKELLCLNNVQGQELIIEAKLLGDKKQILVLVFDPTSDLQIQEIRSNELQKQIKILIEKIIYQSIVLNFSIILFALLITYKITNKISHITLKARMLIFQYHNSIFKILELNNMKIKQKGSLNCLDQLELAFANLNNRTLYNKKQNPYCKILTNLCTFPSKECLDFSRLKQSTNQLHNENYCLPKFIIKKMVNETQQLLKIYSSPYSTW